MTTNTPVSPGVRRYIILVDHMSIFFARHWLLLINAILLVFITLPALAPVLMQLGLTGPADVIYTAYRLTCHQLAFRTYFFFGDQPVYAVDQLRASLAVHDDDLLYWSGFRGNEQLGYKMAWCERDAAIYTAILIAGLLFGLMRTSLRPLNWRLYLAFIAPMAIDGFWQLFTSPIVLLPFLPIHESTWELRTITGALFGVGSVWLIYPYVQEAMRDVNVQAQAQLGRAMLSESRTRHSAGDSAGESPVAHPSLPEDR